MNTLKDRLEELMAEHGLTTQQQLADFAGVSKGLVGQWFNGSTGLGAKPLLAFGKKTRFSTQWLADGTGEKYQVVGEMRHEPPKGDEITGIHRPALWSSNDPLPEEDYAFAPYLKESTFTGGNGSFEIPDYNGFRLPFGKATLRRKGIQPDNVFCCTLTGDSMEERIADGAAIAVDTGDNIIKDGKIYAFRHDDLFRVKYLSRLPGGRVKIKSHNDAVYPEEEASLEGIQVIGRVFWWSVLD